MLKNTLYRLAAFIFIMSALFFITDSKVYASPGTVTIKYNKYGNSISAVEAALIKGADIPDRTVPSNVDTVKLDAQNYSYKGHLFAGWDTNPAGTTVVYQDKADISEFVHAVEEDAHRDLVLYAVWKKSYTVRFDLGIKSTDPDKASVYGKTGYLDETKTYYDVEVMIPEPRTKAETLDVKVTSGLPYLVERIGKASGGYIRQGYEFGGWYATLKPADNITYPTAQNINSYSGLKIVVSADDYKKFKLAQGSSSVPFEATTSDWTSATGNVIYMHPYWIPNTLTIKYDYNKGEYSDGTASHSQKVKVTAGKAVAGTTEPKAYLWNPQTGTKELTLEGYVFKGWSDKKTSPGETPENIYEAGEEIPRRPDDDKEFSLYNTLKNGNASKILYAVWEEDLYDVAYSGLQNGINVTPVKSFYDKGIKLSEPRTLPANQFTATGYKFIGWTLDRTNGKVYNSGSTINFEDMMDRGELTDEMITHTSETENATITFYAVWKAYDITNSSVIYKTEWDDNNDQDGLRPKSVASTLTEYVNSSAIGSWSGTISPSKDRLEFANTPDQYLDQSLNVLVTPSYKLTLNTEPSGYSVTISDPANKSSTGLVKFVHSPKTTEAIIKINFEDSRNQDGGRPKTVTIILEDSNGEKHKADVTINNDSTEYKFEGLPKYKDGKELKYKLTVDTKADGYTFTTKEDGMRFTVTGTYTSKKIDINVSAKFSNDDNNSGKTRPEIIQGMLVGSDGSKTNVVLSAAANYSTVIKDLPANKSGGQITYKLQVANVAGYEMSVTGNQTNGFIIDLSMGKTSKDTLVEQKYQKEQDIDANKQAAKPAESEPVTLKNVSNITVTTIWNDEKADGIRPSSYIIALVGDNDTEQEMVLSEETGYKGTFEDVPDEDEEHNDIAYRIRVFEIEGYTSHVYKDKKDPTKFTIENFKPDVSNSYVSKVKKPDYMDPAEIDDHEAGFEVEAATPEGYEDEYPDYPDYTEDQGGIAGKLSSVSARLIILCGVSVIVIAGAGFGLWYIRKRKK